MDAKRTVELFSMFEKLADPRVERTRAHRLIDIVALTLCATICGADSWADVERFGKAKLDFLRRFLELPSGIPSHDTIGRVMARLDPAQLQECLAELVAKLGGVAGDVVAIDGKTLRRSHDHAGEPGGKAALHLVNAWACGARVVLGQVATRAKSNEITAIPLLLQALEIAGATVTIDAMGCQKEIAAAIRGRGADYLLALKGNHPKLLAAVEARFMEQAEAGFAGRTVRRLARAETNRGRAERREHYLMAVPPDLEGAEGWPDLKAIGMVVRMRTAGGAEKGEVSFYLSSRAPKVREFAKAARAHWQVENRLHWSLDVTFAEDSSRTRKGNGPEIAGAFRRLALSILKRDTSCRASLAGKRNMAGWNDDVLAGILQGFFKV